MYKNIYLENSDKTYAIGEKIGAILKSGNLVCLHGDLGAGKTHISKGIAKGMGVVENVCSPTFTIVQEYMGSSLELLHFDVYRLSNSEELEFIGFDDYLNRKAVMLMEWPENVEDALLKERIDIFLRYSEDGARFMDIYVTDNNMVEAFKSLDL